MLKVQWYYDENNKHFLSVKLENHTNNKHYCQGTKYIFKSNAMTQKNTFTRNRKINHIQYDNQLNKASLKE